LHILSHMQLTLTVIPLKQSLLFPRPLLVAEHWTRRNLSDW
jgi:hypothetical protein